MLELVRPGKDFLTENGSSTAWLRGTSVDVKISVSIWTPLSQNSGPCVDYVYKVGVVVVQVSRAIRALVEYH
jgi:hypothetical protein